MCIRDRPIEDCLEELILKEYKYYRNQVADLCSSDPLLQAILSGVALGDRRTNSTFRRAQVSFKNGMECVEELRDMGVLKIESPMHHLTNQSNSPDIAKRLIITTPFLRFWFAFVSPIFKGIRDGEYQEFFTNFKNKKGEFVHFVFEQLCHEFIKKQFSSEGIYSLGRYWDDRSQIELIAKTTTGKIIAGSCKYTNTKIKKSHLNYLFYEYEKIQLPVDVVVLFSKSGFSSELKSLKEQNLKLYTTKSLKALL